MPMLTLAGAWTVQWRQTGLRFCGLRRRIRSKMAVPKPKHCNGSPNVHVCERIPLQTLSAMANPLSASGPFTFTWGIAGFDGASNTETHNVHTPHPRNSHYRKLGLHRPRNAVPSSACVPHCKGASHHEAGLARFLSWNFGSYGPDTHKHTETHACTYTYNASLPTPSYTNRAPRQ